MSAARTWSLVALPAACASCMSRAAWAVRCISARRASRLRAFSWLASTSVLAAAAPICAASASAWALSGSFGLELVGFAQLVDLLFLGLGDLLAGGDHRGGLGFHGRHLAGGYLGLGVEGFGELALSLGLHLGGAGGGLAGLGFGAQQLGDLGRGRGFGGGGVGGGLGLLGVLLGGVGDFGVGAANRQPCGGGALGLGRRVATGRQPRKTPGKTRLASPPASRSFPQERRG